MRQKLITITSIAISIHLLISIGFIFAPFLLHRTPLSYLYRVYLLPGPFFGEDKIADSYILTMSEKKDKKWSVPVNPLMHNYNRYYDRFNPTHLYRNRIERSLYQGFFLPSRQPVPCEKHQTELVPLMKYLNENYNIGNADSARIFIIRKTTGNFRVSFDTLCTMSRK